MGSPTELYVSLIVELERRRRKLGLPMWKLDDLSGVQDGYYAKVLHVSAPSGRQAGWTILDYLTTALFPRGVRVKLIACRKKPMPGQPSINQRTAREIERSKTDPPQLVRLLLSERAREAGKKGAAARNNNLTARQRRKLARKAAVVRWSANKAAAKGERKDRNGYGKHFAEKPASYRQNKIALAPGTVSIPARTAAT
jgi:hypothetical protein